MRPRDFVRQLFAEYGDNDEDIIQAYVVGEWNGIVRRSRNIRRMTPEEYGRRLLRDGKRQRRNGAPGWLYDKEPQG